MFFIRNYLRGSVIGVKSEVGNTHRRILLSLPSPLFRMPTVAFSSTPARIEHSSDIVTPKFILKEGNQIKIQEGDCTKRVSPSSTFKISLALMAFDSGILKSGEQPCWEYRPEYQAWNPLWNFEEWKQPQRPLTWIRYSVIWYSQLLTTQLQMKRFNDYVRLFKYGNQDLTGCPGKNNGLTHAWLGSSLKISPLEQVAFLEKLANKQLPVSDFAHESTRRLLYLETLSNQWQLFGKTGSGHQLDENGNHNPERQFGWFVGWAQKDERQVYFAQQITDTKSFKETAGSRAKALVKARLINTL